MQLVRSLGVLIAWLSAALAGLTAALYAFGYVITAANLRMLGLSTEMVRYEPAVYIARGAWFIWDLAEIVVRSAVIVAVTIVLLLGLVILLRSLARRLGAVMLSGSLARRLGARLMPLSLERVRTYRAHGVVLAYVVLLVTMLLLLEAFFYGESDEHVRHLLFLRDELLLADDEGAAEQQLEEFGFLLLATLLALVLAGLAARLTTGARWRAVWILPFAVGALGLADRLLSTYGATRMENFFHEISLAEREGVESDGPLYVIARSGQEFVLWSPAQAEVVWLPVQQAGEVRIGRRYSIAQIRCRLRGDKR